MLTRYSNVEFREHPLVPSKVPVYGYIYDVRAGRLNEVKAATKAGKPKAA